jgi:hypothetical protein
MTKEWDTKDRCGEGKYSTGSSDPFLPWCVAHDEAYLKGGTLKELASADKSFLKGIWLNTFFHPWRAPRALFYSAAVIFAGRFFWRPCDRTKGEICEAGRVKRELSDS